ncbi:MAG: SGNH/GDSL hydrolase family protein [Tepidisphaeraceae bacterium]
MKGQTFIKLAALACVTAATNLFAAPAVKDGDVIEIIGDSITEGRNYGSLIEDYLLMCQPAKVRVMQFGWGGERVTGFNNRLPDLLSMKPTVATLCYGMNDGEYRPVTDAIRNNYRTGLLSGVQALQQAGVKVIVGSPGCVDTATFKNSFVSPADYNTNLAALRDEARQVATTTGSTFADVHSSMLAAMAAGKTKYGQNYSVAGGDGIHPNVNGGLVMAYAFLKNMDFDGNVGTLYVDMADHTAKTFGGHKFVKAEGNAFTFESTQYPFCFWGDPSKQSATNGLLDAIPFNADLNRFTLTVAGPAKRYTRDLGQSVQGVLGRRTQSRRESGGRVRRR